MNDRWIAGLLLLAATLCAAPVQQHSLEDFYRIARSRSDGAKLIELRYKAGHHEKNVYRSEALPYVSYDLTIGPSRQSLATTSQSFDFESMIQGILMYVDTSALVVPQQQPPAMASEISGMGVRWNLLAVQPLITFGKVRSALRASRIRKDMLEDVRSFEYDTLMVGVLRAYAAAYIVQEREKIAQKAYSSAQRMVQRMQREHESGGIPRTLLLRSRARMYGAEAALDTARSATQATLRFLALKTGLETSSDFVLALDTSAAPFDYTTGSHTDGLGYTLQEYWLELRRNEVTYERAKIFPSINLAGSVSNQFLITDDDGSPEFGDIFNPDYITATIGANLTWTIFDGWRSPSIYLQKKVQLEQAEISFRQFNDQTEMVVDRLRDGIAALNKTINALEMLRQASRAAYQSAEMDFDAGALGVGELLDIETEWLEAEKTVNDTRMQKLLVEAQLKLLLGLPIYEDAQ